MPIQKYMNDIQKIVPKSDVEIMAMLQEYREIYKPQNGPRNTPRAIMLRNALVEQNLKLVFKVASMYRRSGIPFADLVAEGNLGIIRGIEKFDINKGVKVGYYLFRWARAMILRYIVRNAHLVKMGTTQAQRKLFFNLSKTKAKAKAQGYDISDKEVAELLGVKEQEVKEMSQRLSAPAIQIEAFDSDNSSNLQRLLRSRLDNSEDAEAPDSVFEREEFSHNIREIVDTFIDRLNETQACVFKARFCQDEPKTFETIGQQLNGLTKQRVQQIDAELKGKFKKYLSHNQISLQA